jgi:hypothetical protein
VREMACAMERAISLGSENVLPQDSRGGLLAE